MGFHIAKFAAGSVNGTLYYNGAWFAAGAKSTTDEVTHVFRCATTWEKIPLPAEWGASSATAIAGGNGILVIVGYSGNVARSTDGGDTWAKIDAGTADSLYDVIYALGNFIIVGASGLILTSPDGLTWTARTSGTVNSLYGIAFDGVGRLIASGVANHVQNSYGSVTSWPTLGTGAYGRPCYHAPTNRFYINGSTSGDRLMYLTPGSTTRYETSFANTFGWNGYGSTSRPIPYGSGLLQCPTYNKQLGHIAISGSTHTLTEQLDGDGNSIIGAYMGGSSNGTATIIHFSSGRIYSDETTAIGGTVLDGLGNPAQRVVRIYERESGEIITETQSDPVTGIYGATFGLGQPEVQRIVLADDVAEGVLHNDILDRVIPG